MNRIFKLCFIFSCCFSALVCTHTAMAEDAAPAASEPEKPWSVDMNVALMSDYMFRGQNLYDGSSIQPYIGGSYDIGYGKIGATSWMHISGDGATNVEEFFEIDWGLTYELELDPVTLTIGNLWYTYPNKHDHINDTSEGFISVALDDSGFNDFYTLSPKLTASKDWEEFDYNYFELNLSHEYATESLGKGVTLTPYVAFGFASNSEKVYADNGLEQISEGLTLALPLGELTLSPSVNYTHKIDDLTVNQFWFGMTLGYSL